VLVELVERRLGVCSISGEGWDVEDRHLLLQGIDVDVDDLCVSFRFTLRGNPGHVAVDYQDEIGGLDAVVNAVAKS
jgi:hypothetical protein